MVVWIDPYRFASAGGGEPGGLVAKYTTSVDTSPVQYWYDDTATGADMEQPTATYKPTTSGGFVSFDGSNDYTKSADGAVPFDRQYTIFMKVNWAGLSSAFDIFLRLIGADHGGRCNAYASFSGGFEHHCLANATTAGSIKYYTAPSTGTYHTITLRSDATNAGTIVRYNGTQQTPNSNPYSSDPGASGSTGTLWVGADAAGANAGQIIVPELRIYNSVLSDGDCATIEALM